MENDKDIKIETEEDVGLDDKIKAGENESPCFAAGKIVKGSKQNKIKYLCDIWIQMNEEKYSCQGFNKYWILNDHYDENALSNTYGIMFIVVVY